MTSPSSTIGTARMLGRISPARAAGTAAQDGAVRRGAFGPRSAASIARPYRNEMQERVRQYIAGRTEMITGDRMVLVGLTRPARRRQRYALGLPVAMIGLGTAGSAP